MRLIRYVFIIAAVHLAIAGALLTFAPRPPAPPEFVTVEDGVVTFHYVVKGRRAP